VGQYSIGADKQGHAGLERLPKEDFRVHTDPLTEPVAGILRDVQNMAISMTTPLAGGAPEPA
jgi:hypothetical protein